MQLINTVTSNYLRKVIYSVIVWTYFGNRSIAWLPITVSSEAIQLADVIWERSSLLYQGTFVCTYICLYHTLCCKSLAAPLLHILALCFNTKMIYKLVENTNNEKLSPRWRHCTCIVAWLPIVPGTARVNSSITVIYTSARLTVPVLKSLVERYWNLGKKKWECLH